MLLAEITQPRPIIRGVEDYLETSLQTTVIIWLVQEECSELNPVEVKLRHLLTTNLGQEGYLATINQQPAPLSLKPIILPIIQAQVVYLETNLLLLEHLLLTILSQVEDFSVINQLVIPLPRPTMQQLEEGSSEINLPLLLLQTLQVVEIEEVFLEINLLQVELLPILLLEVQLGDYSEINLLLEAPLPILRLEELVVDSLETNLLLELLEMVSSREEKKLLSLMTKNCNRVSHPRLEESLRLTIID